MEEQLILFETAVLAKVVGFDVKTTYYYYFDKTIGSQSSKQNWNSSNDSIFSAPTQALLQKWFRKKHYIITPTTDFITWECHIFHPDWGDENILRKNSEGNWFKTYEEALEAGLQEALCLMKKQ